MNDPLNSLQAQWQLLKKPKVLLLEKSRSEAPLVTGCGMLGWTMLMKVNFHVFSN